MEQNRGRGVTGGLGVLSSLGVRPGLPEKAAFGLKLGRGESELCRDLGGEHSRGGNSKCKVPEAGISLVVQW